MLFKKIYSAALVILILSAYSCSKQDQKDAVKKVDTVTKKVTTAVDTLVSKKEDTIFKSVKIVKVNKAAGASEEIQKKLDGIFSHYNDIREELVQNDSINSKKHALEMFDDVVKVATDLGKDLGMKWKPEETKLTKYQNTVNNATTLKEQREWFDKLSVSLTEIIQKYGLPGETIYEMQSVPAGKKWLVDSKDSGDPYTGNEDNVGGVKVLRAWEFE